MKRTIVTLLVGIGLATGSAANAQRVTGNPDNVAALLRGMGRHATVTPGPDRMIQAASDDDIWSLWFDDCTSPDACRSLQFYRGFVHAGLTDAALREFSRTHSPARAYRDSEGDVALERNLTIESDGLDRASFAAVIQAWETTLRDLSRLAN